MGNFVFIAASLDGFIARLDGSIDWLTNIDNPTMTDYGYADFINRIDAIVMGKNTYMAALNFKTWPYTKPVFVLSTTLNENDQLPGGARILSPKPPEIVSELNGKGLKNLYIDGGKTIKGFLDHNLIDEMVITRVPILLGSGIPLFSRMEKEIRFTHKETIVYPNGLVKSHYERNQDTD